MLTELIQSKPESLSTIDPILQELIAILHRLVYLWLKNFCFVSDSQIKEQGRAALHTALQTAQQHCLVFISRIPLTDWMKSVLLEPIFPTKQRFVVKLLPSKVSKAFQAYGPPNQSLGLKETHSETIEN